MNTSIFRSHGALRAVLAAVAALLLAAGCGGGGCFDNMSAPQGRAFTEGTITGFGSIIVNGIRFDESTAQVIDDDGEAHDRNELKLGMSVQVVSSRASTAGRCRPTRAGCASARRSSARSRPSAAAPRRRR